MKCQNCHYKNPVGMRFCGHCGTALAQICPNCQFLNPLAFLYCGMCGFQFTAPPVFPTSASSGTPLPSPTLPTPVEIEKKPVAPALRVISHPGTTLPFSPNYPTQPVYTIGPLAGERRVATAILADVRSSTDMMEQIGTEAWVEMMNHIFQILEGEIDHWGGQVDQFRGDGLVAFFGAKTAHEDDPERAILASLSMQEKVKAYATDLAKRQPLDLKLRVGVNTGELIVATVGDKSSYQEDTAMGEAVALAARMEQSAQPGTVLVSEYTYRLTEAKFQWEPLGEIPAKGISHPVKIYRPLAPQRDAETISTRQTSVYSISLAGRTVQFQSLKQAIGGLASGRGGIVVLTGDKGIGKTFLITQVQHELVRQGELIINLTGMDQVGLGSSQYQIQPGGITWIRSVCRSYDQNWPYTMWQNLLHNWLGVPHPEESGEVERVLLQQRCEKLWGDQAERFYPYLGAMLAIPLDEVAAQKVRYLTAEGLRRQIFSAVRAWVEALAANGPIILAFSDVHWVDTTSLELLRYCLSVCDTHAILWLLVFRPDRTSPVWGFRHFLETEYPHRLTLIDLPPLNEQESRLMIQQIIGPQVLSSETSSLVIQKAEGNPYYIDELLRSLIAQGVLVQDPTGVWYETRQVTSLDLPDSLQSLLLARVDRLFPEDRRILQIAAVIGTVFWRNLLPPLVGDTANLPAVLNNLQKAQFIIERAQVPILGMEYAFSSSLIREVAYESLLNAQRRMYHMQVAEELEELYGVDASEQQGGLIAYHYRHAGNQNRELYYTLQAAEQAMIVYANSEALTLFTRALELLDKMEADVTDKDRLYAIHTQRFDVYVGRSRMYYMIGDTEAGDADAMALLPLAEEMPDDPVWMIDALLNHPKVRYLGNRVDLPEGLAKTEQALTIARKIGDRRRELYCLAALGNIYVTQGDTRWHEIGDQVLAMARELGDEQLEAEVLLGIGSAYGMDNLDLSMKYLQAAVPICEKLNDKGIELRLLRMLGEQYERKGDYYCQLVDFDMKRLRISREIGDRFSEGYSLMYCGQQQSLYLGDYESGLALLQEALLYWENITDRLFPLLRIVQVQAALGQYGEAQKYLGMAQPVGERISNSLGRAGLYLVTMIFYNMLGDEAHLRKIPAQAALVETMVAAKEVSRQYEMCAACESSAAYLSLANLLVNRADSTEEYRTCLQRADVLSQKALGIYQQFGFIQIIECTTEEILFRRSQALAALGQVDQSADFLEQAYQEMMRKYNLIPTESPYRKTYLEQIVLHRQIKIAYDQAHQEVTNK